MKWHLPSPCSRRLARHRICPPCGLLVPLLFPNNRSRELGRNCAESNKEGPRSRCQLFRVQGSRSREISPAVVRIYMICSIHTPSKIIYRFKDHISPCALTSLSASSCKVHTASASVNTIPSAPKSNTSWPQRLTPIRRFECNEGTLGHPLASKILDACKSAIYHRTREHLAKPHAHPPCSGAWNRPALKAGRGGGRLNSIHDYRGSLTLGNYLHWTNSGPPRCTTSSPASRQGKAGPWTFLIRRTEGAAGAVRPPDARRVPRRSGREQIGGRASECSDPADAGAPPGDAEFGPGFLRPGNSTHPSRTARPGPHHAPSRPPPWR